MRAEKSEIELFSANARQEAELLGFQPGQLPRNPFLANFLLADYSYSISTLRLGSC
jgi:hypothetical protein